MGDENLRDDAREDGGLDFGTMGSSAVLGGILIVLVILEMRKLGKQVEQSVPAG